MIRPAALALLLLAGCGTSSPAPAEKPRADVELKQFQVRSFREADLRTTASGRTLSLGRSDGAFVADEVSIQWRVNGVSLRAEKGDGLLRGATYGASGEVRLETESGITLVTDRVRYKSDATVVSDANTVASAAREQFTAHHEGAGFEWDLVSGNGVLKAPRSSFVTVGAPSIEVSAAEMALDEDNGIAVYRGAAKLDQQDVQLRCDEITLSLGRHPAANVTSVAGCGKRFVVHEGRLRPSW